MTTNSITIGLYRRIVAARVASVALIFASNAAFAENPGPARTPGLLVWRSSLSFAMTVEGLKRDVQAKNITVFDVIDQAKLAADAGIALRPSTLLIFGNPPLGVQFLTANPLAGLDWPARLLIYEDNAKSVWIACNDFAWIAQRHAIRDREAAFAMASNVVASIVAAVNATPA